MLQNHISDKEAAEMEEGSFKTLSWKKHFISFVKKKLKWKKKEAIIAYFTA